MSVAIHYGISMETARTLPIGTYVRNSVFTGLWRICHHSSSEGTMYAVPANADSPRYSMSPELTALAYPPCVQLPEGI